MQWGFDVELQVWVNVLYVVGSFIKKTVDAYTVANTSTQQQQIVDHKILFLLLLMVRLILLLL